MSLFEEAYEIAKKNLNPAHPFAIDAAGYYSYFVFNFFVSVDKALKIATEAFNKALFKLPELPDEMKSWANGKMELLSTKINEWINF